MSGAESGGGGSSLADQLAARKLKKPTGPIKDQSGPKLHGNPNEDDIKRAHAQVLDCNLEVWLDAIRDVTFPTALVPLKLEDAVWICNCYKDMKRDGKLSDANQKQMDAMCATVQTVIEQTRASPKAGVFIKLSCRSAKDSLAPSVLQSLYEEYAKADGLTLSPAVGAASDAKYTATATAAATADIKSAPTTNDTANSHLIALVKAATAIMRVETARYALHTIVTSDRIFEDLTMAVANPSRYLQNIIVRSWIDIDADMEWRGFVFNHTLNALSQYNHVTCFKRLVAGNGPSALATAVSDRVRKFFDESVKARLKKLSGYANYVIDFAVSGDKLDQIWVIEINPWQPATDSALFSFKTEVDGVLSRGPFELRVRTEPHAMIKQIWESNQRQFMKTPAASQTATAAS